MLMPRSSAVTMRVAVDARTVYSATRRGTGKNLVDLYRSLARLQPGWEFVMLHQRGTAVDDPFLAEPNVTTRAFDVPGDRWGVWEQAGLTLAARFARASLLHSPANTGPAVPLVPLVVTIHDLIPLEISPDAPDTQRWSRNVRRAAGAARRILTPSTHTKTLLRTRFRIPDDKIVVNPWASDSSAHRVVDPVELDRVRRKYGVSHMREYVLGFGAADPRKNTYRIIEAWAALPADVRAGLGLLLVGLQEPFLAQAREHARGLAPESGWSLEGFASEEDLPALLSGAALLCYPSLSEGFGLPVLDAFACGTPIVTSTTSSLPEVAGDAAVLVDPLDVRAITAAMLSVGTNDELRASLRAAGFARLQLYSWERCAKTVAGVFREVA
jgi:glycosyltransferase involved in cell wall biosynthesis